MCRGLKSLVDPGAPAIGFDGMPLCTYHFPQSFIQEKHADCLSLLHDYLAQAVGVTPGCRWICDLENRQSVGMLSEEEVALGVSYVHMCPTKKLPHCLYAASELVGGVVSTFHIDPSSFILHQKLR